MDFWWICIRFSMDVYDFVEEVLPAYVGSTILHIDTKHFESKNALFALPIARARSVVRSVGIAGPLLTPSRMLLKPALF